MFVFGRVLWKEEGKEEKGGGGGLLEFPKEMFELSFDV